MSSLESASELGSRLDSLRVLRRILARAIDECESKRDLSSLANRYSQVCEQIAGLEAAVPDEESAADKFEARVIALRGGSG